jgi:hypothetical protein
LDALKCATYGGLQSKKCGFGLVRKVLYIGKFGLVQVTVAKDAKSALVFCKVDRVDGRFNWPSALSCEVEFERKSGRGFI